MRAVLPFLQSIFPATRPSCTSTWTAAAAAKRPIIFSPCPALMAWSSATSAAAWSPTPVLGEIGCAVRPRQAALHRLAVQRYSLRASHSQGGRSDKSGEAARRHAHSPRRPIRRPYQLHHRQNTSPRCSVSKTLSTSPVIRSPSATLLCCAARSTRSPTRMTSTPATPNGSKRKWSISTLSWRFPKAKSTRSFPVCPRSKPLPKRSAVTSCCRCSVSSGFPDRPLFCRRRRKKIAPKLSKRRSARVSRTRNSSRNTSKVVGEDPTPLMPEENRARHPRAAARRGDHRTVQEVCRRGRVAGALRHGSIDEICERDGRKQNSTCAGKLKTI